MGWVIKFAKSSIGAKIIMALTGVVLFGFVVAHMAGNLQIFLGQDAFNGYGAFLQGQKELLWTLRTILLISAVLHAASGLRLAALNRAARPVAYTKKSFVRATFTSRTMALSGTFLLAYIVFHLLHFTMGLVQPEAYHLTDPQGRHDIYSMFILGFQNVPIAVGYIVAMVCLAAHLNHGASSLFQTLGVNHPRFNGLIHRIGPTFSVIVAGGNIVMVLAVLLGWIQLPAGVLK